MMENNQYRVLGGTLYFYWLFRDNNTSGSAGGVKYF